MYPAARLIDTRRKERDVRWTLSEHLRDGEGAREPLEPSPAGAINNRRRIVRRLHER